MNNEQCVALGKMGHNAKAGCRTVTRPTVQLSTVISYLKKNLKIKPSKIPKVGVVEYNM